MPSNGAKAVRPRFLCPSTCIISSIRISKTPGIIPLVSNTLMPLRHPVTLNLRKITRKRKATRRLEPLRVTLMTGWNHQVVAVLHPHLQETILSSKFVASSVSIYTYYLYIDRFFAQ